MILTRNLLLEQLYSGLFFPFGKYYSTLASPALLFSFFEAGDRFFLPPEKERIAILNVEEALKKKDRCRKTFYGLVEEAENYCVLYPRSIEHAFSFLLTPIEAALVRPLLSEHGITYIFDREIPAEWKLLPQLQLPASQLESKWFPRLDVDFEIQLKLTQKCLSNCGFCYYSREARRDFSDFDHFFGFILWLREGLRFPRVSVVLHGGEAFLHPEFEDVVFSLKKKEVLLRIVTGAEPTQHLSARVLEALSTIDVSVSPARRGGIRRALSAPRWLQEKLFYLSLIFSEKSTRKYMPNDRKFVDISKAFFREFFASSDESRPVFFERAVFFGSDEEMDLSHREFVEKAVVLSDYGRRLGKPLVVKFSVKSRDFGNMGCTNCFSAPRAIVDVDGSFRRCTKTTFLPPTLSLAEASQLSFFDLLARTTFVEEFLRRREICRFLGCPNVHQCSTGCPLFPLFDSSSVCAAGVFNLSEKRL